MLRLLLQVAVLQGAFFFYQVLSILTNWVYLPTYMQACRGVDINLDHAVYGHVQISTIRHLMCLSYLPALVRCAPPFHCLEQTLSYPSVCLG